VRGVDAPGQPGQDSAAVGIVSHPAPPLPGRQQRSCAGSGVTVPAGARSGR
jgi:hypothetical protein